MLEGVKPVGAVEEEVDQVPFGTLSMLNCDTFRAIEGSYICSIIESCNVPIVDSFLFSPSVELNGCGRRIRMRMRCMWEREETRDGGGSVKRKCRWG